MDHHLVVIDRSMIRPGKLDELKTAVEGLVRFVEEREARPLAYHVYLDAKTSMMTVVQVHPDAASMEKHMELAGPAFPKFKDLLRLERMDVYGRPATGLLQRLLDKAKMLGTDALVVHADRTGFQRYDRSPLASANTASRGATSTT